VFIGEGWVLRDEGVASAAQGEAVVLQQEVTTTTSCEYLVDIG